MPPEKKGLPQKLPVEEIALLKRWVAAEAPWPEGRMLDLFERTNDVRAGRDWWSLQPIRRPDIPKLKRCRNHRTPSTHLLERVWNRPRWSRRSRRTNGSYCDVFITI